MSEVELAEGRFLAVRGVHATQWIAASVFLSVRQWCEASPGASRAVWDAHDKAQVTMLFREEYGLLRCTMPTVKAYILLLSVNSFAAVQTVWLNTNKG